MATEPIRERLSRVVLGQTAEQRRRMTSMLLTTPIYIVCMGLVQYSISLGLFERQLGRGLIVYVAANYLGFCLALSMGWHLRRADPEMTLERLVLGIIGVVLAYAWGEATRSNALLLLSVLMALGMFSLPPRQIMAVGFLTVGLVGAVVAVEAYQHRGGYPLRQELLQFGVAACCLLSTAVIAKQVQELRKKLMAQKHELRDALARVEHLAQRDPLTGLVNRRYMQELIELELMRQERGHGSPCALAIVDLDYFKRINDSYGHAVGDQVLCGLAREAQALLRPSDVISRWGGEEFLLLLPCTSAQQATQAATRFGSQLAQACLVPSQPQLRVTASIGLAERAAGESLASVLERADQALYRAKQDGRNRVVVAEPASTAPGRSQVLIPECAVPGVVQ